MKTASAILIGIFCWSLLTSCSTTPERVGLVYWYIIQINCSVEGGAVHISRVSGIDPNGERSDLGVSSQTITLSPGTTTLYSYDNLAGGNYSGIKLRMDSGKVIVNGVSYYFSPPDQEVDVSGSFVVEAGHNNYIDLTFDVGQSILPDGEGGYILKPVLRVSKEVPMGYGRWP